MPFTHTMKTMKKPATVFLTYALLLLLAACSSNTKNMNADINRDMNRKLDKINIATFDMRNPEEAYNDPELFYSILANNQYSQQQLALINYSRQFLGTTYIFGATNPNEGFDCSGFTQFAFKNAIGTKLPRTALQMSQVGYPVDQYDLKAGDLVFFNTRGFDYSHVGIYIGEGKFFHASTKLNAVVLGDLSSPYFSSRYNGARRVMGESNFVQYNGLNTSG